jgi:hypothetical protein
MKICIPLGRHLRGATLFWMNDSCKKIKMKEWLVSMPSV